MTTTGHTLHTLIIILTLLVNGFSDRSYTTGHQTVYTIQYAVKCTLVPFRTKAYLCALAFLLTQ